MILLQSFVVTLILILLVQISESARILGLFTAPSKSHIIVHMALAEALAERGHDVTVVTTNSLENRKKSIRYIQVNSLKQMPPDVIGTMTQSLAEPFGNIQLLEMLCSALMPVHNASLHHPNMRELMENESFDLVILGYFMNDFLLGVAAHFKCPVVVNFMVRPLRFLSNLVGQPADVITVPKLLSNLDQPMSFLDRIKNVVYHLYDLYLGYGIEQEMRKYYDYNFPSSKYPSLDEMRKNVSLVFTNHHFSEGPIFASVPALIEVGGIQIKENPDPLPKDIQNFLDEANNGAVFFSFGSNFPTSRLKPQTADDMIKVFSKLKQRVLMKWDTPNVPLNATNILFKQWLPQDDILAHPNVKLFITHGGKGSVAETQYHAVPIVGIPLFGDQVGNIQGMIQAGFGVRLNLHDINEETLSTAVREVLENTKYRNNIKKYSNIYRDRPMSPRETAAYWVDYVIRHRGAKHLQSPAVNMNVIQYYGVDIFVTFLVIFSLVWKLFSFVVKIVLKIIRKNYNAKCKAE